MTLRSNLLLFILLPLLVTSVPLFTHCTPDLIELIVAKLRVESYPQGAYIIQKGKMGRALYVLRQGLCHAMVEAGSRSALALYGPVSAAPDLEALRQRLAA